jgi:hypothetical protein
VALSSTGVALILGATGALGRHAPEWIVPASVGPYVALLLWIVVSSVLGWRRLGPVVFATGMLNAAAFALALVVTLFPYTHTNDTVGMDSLVALLVLASVPAWLVAVAVRLWKTRPKTESLPG